MAAVAQLPTPFLSGSRLIDGSDLNNALGNQKVSTTQSQTASGTTRATATQINTVITNFTTVGASGQAILPASVPGTEVLVFNNGAQTLTLIPFESSGTTIDGAATTTLSTANRVAVFVCVASGVWISALLGAVSS